VLLFFSVLIRFLPGSEAVFDFPSVLRSDVLPLVSDLALGLGLFSTRDFSALEPRTPLIFCSRDLDFPTRSPGCALPGQIPVRRSRSHAPGLRSAGFWRPVHQVFLVRSSFFCSCHALVFPAPPVFDSCAPFFRSRGEVLVWGCSSVFGFRLCAPIFAAGFIQGRCAKDSQSRALSPQFVFLVSVFTSGPSVFLCP
jgi:hypothetical protein